MRRYIVLRRCDRGGSSDRSEGSFQVNGAAVPLKNVYLLQHNNEEGALDGPELRILVADREVDIEVLKPIMLSDLDTWRAPARFAGC